MQIVLSPVDPSQSERRCLNMSALDSHGSLIHPDSPPRELMGGETAHSTHVTQRTDRHWGATDWESRKRSSWWSHTVAMVQIQLLTNLIFPHSYLFAKTNQSLKIHG